MNIDEDASDLRDALRHCEAGRRALELAVSRAEEDSVYPAHCQVAAVELAHAIELAVRVSLRQE